MSSYQRLMGQGDTGVEPVSQSQRKYVTLVSKEGYEYVIKHDCAVVSNVIRDMIKSGTASHSCFRIQQLFLMIFVTIPLPDIVTMLCRYLSGRKGKQVYAQGNPRSHP